MIRRTACWRVAQSFTLGVSTSAVAVMLGATAVQTPSEPEWLPQTSGVTARLRGVSAASDVSCWASGTNGTVVRTSDGGATWQRLPVPGAGDLDFRDIDALDEKTAFVLSIGPGESSRIYKTTDGGLSWREQFVNRDPDAFFDAMAFSDGARGVAVSDSVKGRFVIITTHDGGLTWTRVPDAGLPPALPDEGAFAASGTNVVIRGSSDVWIGTGAAARARVLRSRDGGATWSIADTPLRAGPSAGIFSIAFRSPTDGLVVGGDYKKEAEAIDNAAVTTDGGATWTAVSGLGGYRSAVAYRPGSSMAIAVGPSGADYSWDGGRSWKPAPPVAGLHAVSLAPGGRVGWGVGENGAIVQLRWRN
jgi:photosystem II stability/assembly factor-like uncharacterized protein